MTIEQIHAHLKAGNEVALVTYSKVTIMDARHVDYIRADKDGKGFRLGWKNSVYIFAYQIRLVPEGLTVKPSRRKRSI